MKIAVIGSGIAGLSCAYYMQGDHEVHVLEREERIGGHTATVDVAIGGRRFAIDTGFIVYNDWTYPHFISLMNELGVATRPTNMGFSMSDKATGLEYAGSGLDALFCQRRNLVSPMFLGMLRDIVRFNKASVRDLESGQIPAQMSLGDYLEDNGYGSAFIDYYLVPMGSAIWSADTPVMLDFPLQFFVRFFRNHGLLNIKDRPQWRTIEGGSREYLKPLTVGYAKRIRTGAQITTVRRLESGVEVTFASGQKERFDRVVFACHSDQALELLGDASDTEREILAAIPYQDNEVVLHTDTRMLPKNEKAWSSWNYLRGETSQRATLTYNMNILQGLQAPETFCVTLNDSAVINPYKILGKFNYSHPVFTLDGVRAQERWEEINRGSTWFCGAYWRNGFHEDGVFSGLRVAQAMAAERPGQKSVPSAGMVSAA